MKLFEIRECFNEHFQRNIFANLNVFETLEMLQFGCVVIKFEGAVKLEF